jgi:hypothetical protein
MRPSDILTASNGKTTEVCIESQILPCEIITCEGAILILHLIEISPAISMLYSLGFGNDASFHRLIILMLKVDLHLQMLLSMLVSSKLTRFVPLVFYPSMKPPSPLV